MEKVDAQNPQKMATDKLVAWSLDERSERGHGVEVEAIIHCYHTWRCPMHAVEFGLPNWNADRIAIGAGHSGGSLRPPSGATGMAATLDHCPASQRHVGGLRSVSEYAHPLPGALLRRAALAAAGPAPGIDGWRSVEAPYAPDRALMTLAHMLFELETSAAWPMALRMLHTPKQMASS